MKPLLTWLPLAFGLIFSGAAALPAGDKAEPNVLTVIDQDGKEHTPKNWKFVAGTRKLTWLAPAAEKEPAKGKKATAAGPEALSVSEGEYPLKKRVLTFVPVDSVRS